MNYSKALDIRGVYREVENEFPDKSTEFILEVAAERCRIHQIYRDCDASDIAEALDKTGRNK